MLSGAQTLSSGNVYKLIILSVVIIIMIVVLTLAVGWARSRREQGSEGLGVDWEEEKKKLEVLAAEKKAKRDLDAEEKAGEQSKGPEHEDDSPDVGNKDDVNIDGI